MEACYLPNASARCLMPLLGFLAKSIREATFPTEILQKAMSDWASQYPEKSLPISARCQGLDVNILEANAFDPQDKVAILNSIALPRAQTKAGTPEQHTKAMPKRRVTQKMCFLKTLRKPNPPPQSLTRLNSSVRLSLRHVLPRMPPTMRCSSDDLSDVLESNGIFTLSGYLCGL